MKQIFVFGSNTEGIHGAGAALCAKQYHGAIQGIPMGLQGNSYAIITKDLRIGIRSVKLEFIKHQIFILYEFAEHHSEMVFNITRIGCGHAGFKEQEIAPMFKNLMYASNIVLCDEFKKILKPV